MSDRFFVPVDFAVPDGLTAEEFRLEPLGPQHNAADYAAWTASIDHIQATPGFAGTGWPHEMSLAENLRDLERHAQDFAERCGFTYTVRGTFPQHLVPDPLRAQPAQRSGASWARMTAPNAANSTNPTAPRMAALTRPRSVYAQAKMTGRANSGRASSPPTPSMVNAASPPTAEVVSIPLAVSMRNCTAAPAAAPPGVIRVTAAPTNWEVMTGNHARVRNARRCRVNVQQKWPTSAAIARRTTAGPGWTAAARTRAPR